MGWASITNEKLLALADNLFDVLITVDQNMRYQQNLEHRHIIVITLRVRANKLEMLLPFVPQLNEALETAKPGQVLLIEPATL